MAALTPVSPKPLSFALPIVAVAGAVVGLFFGTANGSGFLGLILGAAIAAGLAYLFVAVIKDEGHSR